MNFRHLRLAGFAAFGIVIGAISAVFASPGWQQIVSPTGNEQVGVDSPNSAVANFVLLSTMRNTTGYQLSATATGTIAMASTTDNLILSGAVTTATVDLPPSPPDGTLASITNGHGGAFTGTITVATTDSSTIVGGSSLTNLASATGAEYQYTAASAIWYRLR